MFWRRKRSDKDFAEEIQSHLALEEDQLRADGLNPSEAHRIARVEFGSIPGAQESFHLKSRWQWLDKLLRDLRFAFRSLRQSPGFAMTAILTLALGMGANTAVFSVMNAMLLRSLPVRDPQNVVYVKTSGAPRRGNQMGSRETSFSYPVYRELRQQKRVLSDLILYVPLAVGKVGIRAGAEPDTANGDMVSGNFFSGLGVPMLRGRGFTEQDEANHAPVAVISYGYWTRQFSRSPDVLNATIYVKGVPLTIVGVAANGFEGTEPGLSIDFWIPLQSKPELNAWGISATDGDTYLNRPEWWCLRMLARLAPGVTKAQAIAALQPVFQQAAYEGIGEKPESSEKPPTLSFAEAKNFPGAEQELGKPVRLLMAMVGLVLIIALTNVIMLLIARNAARQREFSLRLALGAGRNELLGQLLTESLVLVIAGGTLAWGFALLATRTLGQWAQIESSLAPDRTVLLFTLVVLLSTAILFGLAPFRTALAGGTEFTLNASHGISNTDTSKTRTGKIVVGLQMALCVVLLVCAGLLIRTLRNLERIPLGMQTEGLVVFGVTPQNTRTTAGQIEFYQELQNRLRLLPGVKGVTLMSRRIGSGWSNMNSAVIDGRPAEPASGGSNIARSNFVGPDFFHTLGVPVLTGREFTDADSATTLKVAVISELFAQRFFPHEDPLGHHVGGMSKNDDMTIIGVVKDHKYTGIEEKPIPMLWYDYAQSPDARSMQVEMRVQGDPLAILPTARKVVSRLDPNAPLIQPMLQSDAFEQTIGEQLLFAKLAGFFGLLAVLLVATGLYGTLAYRVNMRTAEIGVRMAVGAQRGQVVWMILKDSLLLMLAGVIVGIPLATLVGRALTSSLYGVKPYDIPSYLLAVTGVAIVALAASAVPARRAASVDPLTALRSE